MMTDQQQQRQCQQTNSQQQQQTADAGKKGNDEPQQQRDEAMAMLRRWRSRISTGGMDQLLPGLFVGGLREAMNAQLMAENGIHAVVSVRGAVARECCRFGPGIAQLHLSLNDSPGESVAQHFSTVNTFVHAHRLKNENVLVHCLAGVSRSVCLCMAYLMSVTNLDYAGAMDFVCRQHFGANPNFGFKMQLIKFGQQFVRIERQRLFAEFAHFADQLNEQFRKDCIFTNSLYIFGSSEATILPNKRS